MIKCLFETEYTDFEVKRIDLREGENLEGVSGKDHSLFHERSRAFKYNTTRMFDVYKGLSSFAEFP